MDVGMGLRMRRKRTMVNRLKNEEDRDKLTAIIQFVTKKCEQKNMLAYFQSIFYLYQHFANVY